MGLSKDTVKKLNEVLEARGCVTKCVFCKEGEFELIEDGLGLIDLDLGAPEPLKGDVFLFVCNKCGALLQRTLGPLGFGDAPAEEAK